MGPGKALNLNLELFSFLAPKWAVATVTLWKLDKKSTVSSQYHYTNGAINGTFGFTLDAQWTV